MSSLTSKTVKEISDLLDEYEIKHGPVVDSTRSLYERKLKGAMAKGKKVRSDGAGDSGSYMRSRPACSERELEHETSYSNYSRPKLEYSGKEFSDEPYMYDLPPTSKSPYLKSTPGPPKEAPKAPPSSRLIPLWVQFVFFVAVAVFLYLVFSSMETNEPIKGIE
ncbi:Lamina-associated polypeptide 2 isoforms beta/delta/epsilon/gamma [Dissostichus eleginoides]|uniref:Lamina-associated polypeptide 2 isoforms beta/delta/epsilon/gamma n=1 Tax=Dissostichus eleginoides TaxID=100907 RepID=A0AAD9FEN0_DISEL|nr:Lamina-associated polypeptide 2 isoforms beta/delta/epsilon/gamma [Dissostichus eleginoides]